MQLLKKRERIFSLDALRGLAILIMIFVDAPPGPTYWWQAHATWEGLTLADWAFPGFVFAMGASAAVSTFRREIDVKKFFVRTAILFSIGILFNMKWSFFTWLFQSDFTGADLFDATITHGRFLGLLQRLALTYLFGMLAVKIFKSDAGILFSAIGLLIISSAGFHLYNPAAPFDQANNISGAIDKIFPGANHIYTPTCDPEGLYGTLASAAQFLFGFLAGRILATGAFIRDKIYTLALSGAVLLIAGGLWSLIDIIAKNIWTAPFALITSGGEMFILAAMVYLFDKLPEAKKFFAPLGAFGKNPLFFFLISNIIVAMLFNILIDGTPFWIWIWKVTLEGLVSTEFSVMIFCLLWCLFWTPFALILDRIGIIIKI